MKILFISRAFPPITGGIENQNAALAEWLPKHATVRTLANHGGKASLPWFLPWVLIQSLWLLPRYDAVLLGDGVLAPLGYILKLCSPKKVIASVVHGLDLTFATKRGLLSRLYAHINIPCLKKLDFIIPVSQETASVAQTLGVVKEKCIVIPNGIDPATLGGSFTRTDLETFLSQNLEHKIVLLRVGRYVKHKGNEWFIRNVMPLLPDNVILVCAGAVVKKSTPGDADIYPACQQAVTELHLEHRVTLLTNLPWDKIKLLYHTTDIVVSPNIVVPGTMEGFGISVIEAALCGRPVIASNLQGLKDAIIDTENGLLVEPGHALAWSGAITSLAKNDRDRHDLGTRAAKYTLDHYHWDSISQKYVTAFERFLQK
ncbi:MAG: glycosyltransferase family 4 protein [Candidatus Moranbacteria bacterium]|nr:glycosyltransferase family 4 protein [Candidatus Moranbacteria bacterium]